MRGAILLTCICCASIVFSQNEANERLAKAAVELTKDDVVYDPAYYSIEYPNGDVPSDRGVCTDVVVRAYRKLEIDLQELVHEDMADNFDVYPQNWGLKGPDTNIDHRRVPNLMTFFTRHGTSLRMSGSPESYLPGDIVCWDLGGGILHIGIISDQKSTSGKKYLIVHNIGAGQVLEDVLFSYHIIGHFRYNGL